MTDLLADFSNYFLWMFKLKVKIKGFIQFTI